MTLVSFFASEVLFSELTLTRKIHMTQKVKKRTLRILSKRKFGTLENIKNYKMGI